MQLKDKYTEQAGDKRYQVVETLDHFRGQQSNHTVSIGTDGEAFFNATFMLINPDESTSNMLIDFGNGKSNHVGCSF